MLRLGFIEHRHVADFLKKNGHYATESELIAIIRRLDVDADQRVTFDEWVEAIRPTQPSSSLGASSNSLLAPPVASSSSRLGGASPLRRSEREEESKHGSPARSGLGASTSSAFGHSSPARGGSTYGSQAYSSPARGGGSAAKKRNSPLK